MRYLKESQCSGGSVKGTGVPRLGIRDMLGPLLILVLFAFIGVAVTIMADLPARDPVKYSWCGRHFFSSRRDLSPQQKAQVQRGVKDAYKRSTNKLVLQVRASKAFASASSVSDAAPDGNAPSADEEPGRLEGWGVSRE